jgi:hypothetical protein
MCSRAFVIILLSFAAATSVADSPVYSIDAHIIAAGSSAHARSSCFAMDAVLAEPVAGFSAGGELSICVGELV